MKPAPQRTTPHAGRRQLLAATGLTLAGVALPAFASTTPSREAAPAVALSGSQQWAMRSASGRDYRILVSLPQGPLPYSGGYPVLYVLDANAYFASFHEAKRAQERYRHAIIVGIAYPSEEPLDFLRRSYDFSPPVDAARNTPPQGGQDELLDFIEHTLMPAVARAFPVDAQQQSLFGHSFGGMFAIYALFTRPQLFDHIVAASPSLWWHDRYLLAHEQRFRQRVQAGDVNVIHTSLALVVASGDAPQDVDDARALQQRLEALSAQGLRSSWRVEPGEDHMSLPLRITSQVLAEVLRARR